ncbi:fimbrial protein [Geobacillus zalihae]|uniref:fimbrial protein n=1 Tax=Geobacillus TaxID=129337 RepID=UPI001012929A|nr:MULTISPECIES: fimbrial protein [Geobacillus]RXS86214.1 fimbrial protein [Geobacillus sp. PK12]WKA46659.1 fimbrial protein [Geobacillus zalihae]
MIVDINLLPRKEPRRAAGAVLAAFAVLLLLLGAGGGYWLMERANQRLAALEGELRQVRAEQAAMEAKGKTTEQQQAEQELAKAVEWANRYPLKTVPLLRALAKQLPERGFIMNFSYAGQKTVTMTVQFDAAEEAAYYLDRLEEVHLVKAVKLTGISASGESGGAEGETIVPRYIAQYELELQPTRKEGDNE